MGVCVKADWLEPAPDVRDQRLVQRADDNRRQIDCPGRPREGTDQAELTEIALEILEHLRQTHRRPGARLSISRLADRFGTDPAIVAALSELAELSYVERVDADTIELTTRGFDAAQRLSAS